MEEITNSVIFVKIKNKKFLILKSTLQNKYKKTQIDYIDNIVYFFITFHSFLTSKQL